jgi:hypothetical protein
MKDRIRSSRRALRPGARPVAVCGLLLTALLVATTPAGEVREELSRAIEFDPMRAAQVAAANGGEAVELEWKLGGFLGLLAGLFVPSSGDGVLTFVPAGDDRVEIQLLLTSPKREGEYFLYGAAIDEVTRRTAEVWSSYAYRDSHKHKEQTIADPDVIDFASVIYYLRWYGPTETTRMTIWNDGKTYPVEIKPLSVERRKIDGRKIPVRGYLVRGVKQAGRDRFEERFWLYFARDRDRTPVEIVGKRSLVRVRIQMRGHTGTVVRVDAARPSSSGSLDGSVVPHEGRVRPSPVGSTAPSTR